MTYKIILPVTRPELASKCIDSIDSSIRQHVILVDNTVNNIGVPRSWNIGVSHVLENDIDFLIICSQSMMFENGMIDFIGQLNATEGGKNTKFGWHLIALSNSTLRTCGMFDTNFYPAYFEDSDYIRRMELSGIHEPNGTIYLPFSEVKAYVRGDALSMKGNNAIAVNYGAVADYFKRKWGGDPTYTVESRKILYRHPFNNPDFAIDYFENKTIEELKKEYNL